MDTEIQNEEYHLKKHSAVTQGSYDFVHDITRIEAMTENSPHKGYCVLLTKDSNYWTEGSDTDSYYQFSLHEGRVLTGELAWQNNPSRGTIKGRENPLRLSYTYTCKWEDYSVTYGMRYLLIKISD